MSRDAGKDSKTRTIRRDSVHAGDDIDAPHEQKIPITHRESFESNILRILAAGYLAKVAGGKAVWIVESGSRPLAVVAQQWKAPRFLVPAAQSMASFAGRARDGHIFFRYWCQADPIRVFECLRDGKQLPAKYG